MSLGKHLVIIGAGYAYLMVLTRCEKYVKRGREITVVSPSPYQY